MSLTIRACKNTEDLEKFAKNTYELSLLQFPFSFKREHWIVEKDSKQVGRISANLSTSDPLRGYLGFYLTELNETDRAQISSLLLSTAETWLKEQGVKQVYGPVNYSTWFSYRFQTETEYIHPAQDPQFEWEPAYAPEYFSDWEKNAYLEADHYHTKAFGKISETIQPTEASYDRLVSEGFSMRQIDLRNFPERELAAITKINQQSFSDKFLVEPIDPIAFQKLYAAPLLKHISHLSIFILDPEQKEIGYCFSFVDQGYFVWKTMAVMKEFQGKSLASAAIHYSLKLAEKEGVNDMVTALIREGAQSEVLLKKFPYHQWTHHYRLLKKELK